MLILFLMILFLSRPTVLIADDVFKKIDDYTVGVVSTVVKEKSVSVSDILTDRDVLVSRLAEIKKHYQAEEKIVQDSIDLIDSQIKGALSVGVRVAVDPAQLQDSTVFSTSAAGSATGLTDLKVP